jgi:hypothetical protein
MVESVKDRGVRIKGREEGLRGGGFAAREAKFRIPIAELRIPEWRQSR